MKRSLQLLCLSFALTILLCSCSSVYVDLEKPDTTSAVDVDLEGEYFTDGRLYIQSRFYTDLGFIHEGSWYFVETQQYYTGNVTYDQNGNKRTEAGYGLCRRIVRMNAETGVISSPCLDPVCTHGPGSNCPLMEIEGLSLNFRLIADDWLIIEHRPSNDPVYGTLRQIHGYNIKTGKTIELYADSFENGTFTNHEYSISVFDGKLYIVKHIMDYSATGFKPNGRKPLSDYEPATRSFLYEYDLDNNKVTELFEIPAGAYAARMTNKRYILYVDEEFYTCDLDGSNLQKSDGMEYFPTHKIGTLAFCYLENGFRVYDLKTNQTTDVNIEEFKFNAMKDDVTVTANGLYFNACTSDEEYEAVSAARKEYKNQHKDMDRAELNKLLDEMFDLNKARYSGKAQIWRCDHDGGNMAVVIEIDNATATFIGSTDKYAYLLLKQADPNNNYELIPSINGGKCYIDLKTGEITPIPLLELTLPENAWLTKEERDQAIRDW